MLPLISVIVPIYNVEQYINRCIDSILVQSYENLEVILVDDGSPDSCGKICDEYAVKDRRVKVLHQKNGGLSAARNAGLKVASGDYFAFVDSDDCIHKEMYERLYNDIIRFNVKLAFCQPNMCYGKIEEITCKDNTLCVDNSYVINRCLTESIWWSACTKLYHKSLIEYLYFPEGMTNEDYAIMIILYDHCDKIAVNFNKLYNYCIRENSICTSSLNIRKFDQLVSAENVFHYMQKKHHQWVAPSQAILLQACISLLNSIYGQIENKFKVQEANIYSLIKKNILSSLKNKYLTKTQKMFLIAAYINPVVYKFIVGIYYKYKKLSHA